MSKKDRQGMEAQAPPSERAAAQGMAIDTILEQLASLKDNARSFQTGPDADPIWQKDVDACEAATAILSALQDEGIRNPEEVRDLIHDYSALAEQYRKLHQQYEEPAKPQRRGIGGPYTAYTCPTCHRQVRSGNDYCWGCGKRLAWGRWPK